MNIKSMLDLISAVFITSTFTAGLAEASSDLIAGHFSAQIWSHASWWAQTRREHTRAEDKGRIQNRNPRGTNTKSFHLKSKKHLRSTMFSYYLFLRILVCSSERSSDVCLRSRGDETVKQWLRNSRQRPPRTLHQDRSNTLSFRQKEDDVRLCWSFDTYSQQIHDGVSGLSIHGLTETNTRHRSGINWKREKTHLMN